MTKDGGIMAGIVLFFVHFPLAQTYGLNADQIWIIAPNAWYYPEADSMAIVNALLLCWLAEFIFPGQIMYMYFPGTHTSTFPHAVDCCGAASQFKNRPSYISSFPQSN